MADLKQATPAGDWSTFSQAEKVLRVAADLNVAVADAAKVERYIIVTASSAAMQTVIPRLAKELPTAVITMISKEEALILVEAK